MKITFTGIFNVDDMRLINEFIETQQTPTAKKKLQRLNLIDLS